MFTRFNFTPLGGSLVRQLPSVIRQGSTRLRGKYATLIEQYPPIGSIIIDIFLAEEEGFEPPSAFRR